MCEALKGASLGNPLVKGWELYSNLYNKGKTCVSMCVHNAITGAQTIGPPKLKFDMENYVTTAVIGHLRVSYPHHRSQGVLKRGSGVRTAHCPICKNFIK